MTMIIDGSSGATFPDSSVQAVAGKVIQVVNVVYATTVSSSTNGVWADTGLSATITPKFANSNLLVFCSANGLGKNNTNTWHWLRVTRDGTQSAMVGNFLGYTNSSLDLTYGSACVQYSTPANSTSSTTFKLQMTTGNGSGTVYLNIAGTENSSITIMEIAA